MMDRCTAIEWRRSPGGASAEALRRSARVRRRVSSTKATSQAVRCMAWSAARRSGRQPSTSSRSSFGERAAGGHRIVVAEDDLATGRQERVERMLADGWCRAGQHVRGRADLEGRRRDRPPRPGSRGRRRPVSRGRSAATPRTSTASMTALGRAGLGRVGGQPEAGRGGDRERLLGTARSTGGRARRRRRPGRRPRRPAAAAAARATARFVSWSSWRSRHTTRPLGQSARPAALGQALAGRRDDRGEVEPRAPMGRRPEAHLQVVAAVGRGILDGLPGDAPHPVGASRGPGRPPRRGRGRRSGPPGPPCAAPGPSRRPAPGRRPREPARRRSPGRTQPSRCVCRFRPTCSPSR